MHCEDENPENDSKQFFEKEKFEEIILDVNNNIVDEKYSYSDSYFEFMNATIQSIQ